jgi:hypothetical protein
LSTNRTPPDYAEALLLDDLAAEQGSQLADHSLVGFTDRQRCRGCSGQRVCVANMCVT